ncbi:hypothetical protein GCM10009623_01020 [Nocardioides aestuarii]
MRSQEDRDEQTLIIATWIAKVVLVVALFLAASAISDWLF